jgi:hypothetical protein
MPSSFRPTLRMKLEKLNLKKKYLDLRELK